MTEDLIDKRINGFRFRTNLPNALGVFVVLGLIITLSWLFYSFWREKSPAFFLKGQEVKLSKEMVAVINGYERRETEGDLLKYYIKADRATTFSDNHQELENVYLEVYDESGEKFDKISANQAVYLPNFENPGIFTAAFAGNVSIETRDALFVKSEKLSYDRATETAETDERVEISQNNIAGKSLGAIVKVKEKRFEMLREVDFTVSEGRDLRNARITAGRVLFEQTAQTAVFEQNVNVAVTPENAAPTSARAEKIIAHFANKKIARLELSGNVEVSQKPSKVNAQYATAFFEAQLRKIELRENVQIENTDQGKLIKARGNSATAFFENGFQRAELSENVEIESTNDNQSPTTIRSQEAVYDKVGDRFELKNGVEITTSEVQKLTVIHSANAIYEQAEGKIFLTGGADLTQGYNFIKGDSLTAQLFPDKKLQNAFASGNAYLKQVTAERTTEVSANKLTANFNENQQILKAVVNIDAKVSLVPSSTEDYSRATLSSQKSIELTFRPLQNDSILSQLQTDGRTTITLDAPQNTANPSNKRLIADTVKTVVSSSGKGLLKATAVGNAELYVEPVHAAPGNYKTRVDASRFDCDFYENGNNAKLCVAGGKAKAVVSPTLGNRERRTLSANTLTASFDQKTQDIERFEAKGSAKFSEADRNGLASLMTYTANEEVVRLRGGEPTVFDSRARARAEEIDWDTKNQTSALRGKVSTTYYSQKQTNGATPFVKANTPVYLTAENARLDHRSEVGIYSGNARAWQENNFVRADELIIYQKERRLEGAGRVESLLYNAQRKEGGKTTSQPAFVSAERINYRDADKHLHYEKSVDIRQGPDRITSGVADIYLDDNNDVKQTILENEVTITQPNRRVRGTWAQYTTADETVILRGNPATVEDSQKGTTQGSQLTVALRENRVLNEGSTKQGAGRTRTVYKVKNQ